MEIKKVTMYEVEGAFFSTEQKAKDSILKQKLCALFVKDLEPIAANDAAYIIVRRKEEVLKLIQEYDKNKVVFKELH